MRQTIRVFLFLLLSFVLIAPGDCQEKRLYKVDCTTIQSCLLRAIKNNLDLQVEKYNPQIAAHDIVIAKSVFDPVLTANFNYSYTELQPRNIFDDSNERKDGIFNFSLQKTSTFGSTISLNHSIDYLKTDSQNQFNEFDPGYINDSNITITQPLLRNLGFDVNTAGIQIAENNREISYYAFQGEALRILTQVQLAYLDLVNARKNYELQRESLRLSQKFYKITEARIKAGTLAAADILDAERDIAFKEDSLIVAERQVRAAEDTLKKLINPLDIEYYKNIRVVPVDQPVFQPISADFDQSLQHALENRVDLKQLETQLKNASIQIRADKNSLLPRLDLTADLGFTGLGGEQHDSFDLVRRGEFFDWSIGVALEFPLGNRAAQARYKQSLLEKKQLQAQFQQLRGEVILAVRNAVLDLETAKRRVKTARIAKELAEKQLTNEENKYRAGIIALFQVQDTEQKLTEAKINEINTIIDYQKAIVNLERVEGALLRSLKRYNIKLLP